MKGADRCNVCPADAAALGLADGDRARIASRVGSVEVPVAVTDELPTDPLSGTAVLNGIPVTVTCVR